MAWEDRRPGFGRPQAQINEYVDVCDLFLGILWRRWGSPTGEFTSGFEEEFELAVRRRRQSESPEIWMYFKSVEGTSDLDEQLLRVLNFREDLKQKNELLFREYCTTDEWRETCYDDLLKYVLEQTSFGVPEIRSTASPAELSPSGNAAQAGLPGTDPQLPEQLRRLSEALRDAAREPTSAKFNAQLLTLEDFDLVRLDLLGAALLYESVGQDTLSNNAANLIYRYRNILGSLTGTEVRLALVSLLRDGNSYVPGWYWVKGLPSDRVAQLLENIVIAHPDERNQNINPESPCLATGPFGHD